MQHAACRLAQVSREHFHPAGRATFQAAGYRVYQRREASGIAWIPGRSMSADGDLYNSSGNQPRKRTGSPDGAKIPVKAGQDIEASITHATAPALSILHKHESEGCLHPSVCWPLCACLCPVVKKRSFNWIAENAILVNCPFYCLFSPSNCSFCTTNDLTTIRLLDQGPFNPCFPDLGKPCGPIGYATEEDAMRCCCIDCSWAYRYTVRPCCGELLCTVPCENGSLGFKISTNLCLMCFSFPVGLCLADSKTYRTVVIEQVAHTQGMELTANQKEAIATAPPRAQEVAR